MAVSLISQTTCLLRRQIEALGEAFKKRRRLPRKDDALQTRRKKKRKPGMNIEKKHPAITYPKTDRRQGLPKGREIKTLGVVIETLRNGINCKQDRKGIGDKISRIGCVENAEFTVGKVDFAALSSTDKIVTVHPIQKPYCYRFHTLS